MENDPRFENFVYLQAQNAGLFLGQLNHPQTGKPEINLKAARSVLDSLEMLELKTKGNLASGEDSLLQAALLNLRSLYAKVEASAEAGEDEDEDEDEEDGEGGDEEEDEDL